MSRKTTQQEAVERVSKICLEKNYTFEPFVYVNNKTRIKLNCNLDGYLWYRTYNALISKNYCCAMCTGKAVPTQEQAVERVSKICLEKNYTFEHFVYVNAKTKIKLACNVDGHKWSVMYYSLINNGNGCPMCTGHRIPTQVEATQRVQEICNKKGYTFEPFIYVGVSMKINIKCYKDGCSWNPTYTSFVNKGSGCPQCYEHNIRIRVPQDMLTEWEKYTNKVIQLTKKNKKKLYQYWDGIDFYDKEYIKDNLSLHYNDPKYPTIDHKNPVHHCFMNNIPPEMCGSLENLCVTKKGLNSSKGIKTEKQYKEKGDK
jgi:hypothetical protein